MRRHPTTDLVVVLVALGKLDRCNGEQQQEQQQRRGTRSRGHGVLRWNGREEKGSTRQGEAGAGGAGGAAGAGAGNRQPHERDHRRQDGKTANANS